MKEKIGFINVLICCCSLCTAQQVASSGGFSKQSEATVDWIIGGSLLDIPGFNLGYYAHEQLKQIMDSAFTLNVYPNPATEILNVEITPSDTGKLVLEVFDLKGKAMIGKIVVNESLIQIGITNLNEGAYYLKVTQLNSDQIFRIEKIVKIKN